LHNLSPLKEDNEISEENKREILRDKVVDLVREFIKTECGITIYDLDSYDLDSLLGLFAALELGRV